MSTSAEPQSLLREFVASRSEDAFHRIVQLHTPLIYNAALRVAHGDVHLAQDITQITFSSLAKRHQDSPPRSSCPHGSTVTPAIRPCIASDQNDGVAPGSPLLLW